MKTNIASLIGVSAAVFIALGLLGALLP